MGAEEAAVSCDWTQLLGCMKRALRL